MTFVMVSATTGGADTGATVTVKVTKDNGAQASGGGTVTNSGGGQYNYAPTQAETNATDVGFLFTATGDIPVNMDFHTDQVDGNGFLKVDLVDIAGSAVSTSSAQLGVNVVQYNAQTAQTDGNNLPKVDVEAVNASTTAAQNVSKANVAIGRGTCTTGGSTTSIPTSSFTPNGAASGQFIGRTIIFDATTTTAALQGQATTITASTGVAAPTFTVVALTTAPSSGDTFGVY